MRNRKQICWAIVILVLFVLAICTAVSVSEHKASNTMEKAMLAYNEGNYREAYNLFQTIENKIVDAKGYASICKARMYLEDSNPDLAAMQFTAIQEDLFSDDVRHDIRAVQADIESMQSRQKQERAEQIKNGVPFVGMSESYIAKTSLGSPSAKVRHNTEVKNGNVYTANLYDFYNADGKLIFTARCINGRVTEVWDTRDNPVSWQSSDGNSSGRKYDEDEYNASDYDDPERFYEDHYDDFIDYYDAEDYWYDHYED